MVRSHFWGQRPKRLASPPTAGYLSCRFVVLSRRLIHQIEDAVIGNASVLAKPHFAGAAVAESLTAIPGHLGGQAGERGGVELRGHQPLVAGKAAALDMLRDYHLAGAGAGQRQHGQIGRAHV